MLIRDVLTSLPTSPFCTIIGNPVSHSLSPRLHNEAFRLAGLNWTYLRTQVPEEDMDLVLDVFRLPWFRGANVTVPHKQAIIPYMDDLDSLAASIGAVNTVVPRDGKLIGYNTDLAGFLLPLQSAAERLRESSAVVFGTGGASKAVIHALKWMGLKHVYTVSRTPDPADQNQLSYSNWMEHGLDAKLWVNATPLGLPSHEGKSPLDGFDIPPDSERIGYDLIYYPRITPFMSQIMDKQGDVIGGMDMFVGQAALSFGLWTGKDMPEEAVDVIS